MKVGQTAPLPTCAGDCTRLHAPPSSSRRLSEGSSPRSIRRRTKRGSAASRPMASTRRLRSVEPIKQLLRVDPSAIAGLAHDGFEHRHRLQVVTPARFRLFDTKMRTLQLAQQYRFFAQGARAAPDEPRPLAAFAENKPALEDVKGSTLANDALVKLLPALEEFVAARFVSRRIAGLCSGVEGQQSLQGCAARKLRPLKRSCGPSRPSPPGPARSAGRLCDGRPC